MNMNSRTGFTLVELAIVMTIIGLLIGGILKGQELLENARVTATLAQVKSYDAAVSAFHGMYGGLPGDLRNAQNRLPGCSLSCGIATATTGDDIIGGANNFGDQAYTLNPAALQASGAYETPLFWMHLLKANLISGVTETPLTTATPAAWGVTHPAAKIGGGWVVGHSHGTTGSDMNALGLPGNKLFLISIPAVNIYDPPAHNVLTPGRAAQMDRKMDDGVPNTGSLRGFGTANCTAAGTPMTYVESSTTKNCALMVKIQS